MEEYRVKKYQLVEEQIVAFGQFLQREERSPGTITKYLRDIRAFVAWLGGDIVFQEAAAQWKAYLLVQGYASSTINSMLIALNRFFSWLGWADCRVKTLRVQKRLFRPKERELTKNEYWRLLQIAEAKGQKRLALLMETICATGIRVSELRYITVEALRQRRAETTLKGKIRMILLPAKLCQKLLRYTKQQKTVSGEIFLTKNGTSLSRKQIWAEMKAICKAAGVLASKVFPHNLRHLFAQVFYQACRDIVKLADVLGHASIETTRIYLLDSGREHARQLERLWLIL